MKFRLIVFTLSLLGYSCVCQAQSNTSDSAGTVNVQQGTASSLKVDLSGTSANATALKVDGSAVTQPVNCTSGCSSIANDSVNLTLSSDNVSADYTPSSGIKSAIVSVDFGWTGSITVYRFDNDAGVSLQGVGILWGMGINAGATIANPLVSVNGAAFAVDVTGASFIRFFPHPWTSGTAHIRVTGTTASFDMVTSLGHSLVDASQNGVWTVQPGNTANTAPWLTTDSGTSATASAVPSKAGFIGGNGSGNLTGLTVCDSSAFLQMTTATTTQIVGLLSAKSIRVCGYQIQGSITSTATTVKLQYGTGSNCVTGTTQITPAWSLAASASSAAGTITMGDGLGELFHTAAANELCATNSAAGTVNIFVAYTQY